MSGFPIPTSTNPFDSSSSSSGDTSEDDFYDCQDPQNSSQVENVRSAPLDFENPFDDIEQPALRFDQAPAGSNEFFSPLENAMMQLGNPSPTKQNSGFTTFSDDEMDEHSSLLRNQQPAGGYNGVTTTQSPRSRRRCHVPTEISTGGPMPSRDDEKQLIVGSSRHRERRKSSVNTKKQNMVLKSLTVDENEFTMDYKYILLEDMGTASSWLILLLPYFAFCLSLLLESAEALTVTSIGPLNAAMPCGDDIVGTPIAPTPTEACHCSFQRKLDQYLLPASGRNDTFWYDGTAFESGMLKRIPVVSTSLYGDAVFEDLSTEAVALVAQGMLESSVVLLQRGMVPSDGDKEWTLMFSSSPRTVSMACSMIRSEPESWDCKTPRILDVVFSMPETAVYAGGDIRVNVFYSVRHDDHSGSDDYNQHSTDIFHVYTKTKNASDLFSGEITEPALLVEDIVASSSYTLQHMSPLAVKIDTAVRLGTFLISSCFIIYWCYSMSTGALFPCCRGGKKAKTMLWWGSPWILFPERFYIVVLLFSLLLMQEPVLAAMYFFPMLGASTKLHVAADATIGIGVQGVMFVYLCLFHGFRYHTAKIHKKRMEHQRRNLQLRRAAKYVTGSKDPKSPTEEAISQYTKDYYERFGDVDGSASTAHLRLRNDPCADGWADFLLQKLFLLVVGITSVIATAYCRFPPDDDNVSDLSDKMLHRYKTAYVVSIIVQFTTLFLWMYLIIVAAIVSGRKLRSEPFLSTRPVQLAYRILFAHMSLGFAALAVTCFFNLSQLLRKWSLNIQIGDALQPVVAHGKEMTRTEILIRVLSEVARQFPYSGTAASVGSGRILFATVSILITAFIFLPAHVLDEEETDQSEQNGRKGALQDKIREQRRLRRDKRLVVHLAKQSRTWRVFPIPIEQNAGPTTMLQDNVFQLYKNLDTDANIKERGVVSKGPYTPLFCLELARWLNEASWQAYYSPAGISSKREDPGMSLEALGLRLEGAVYDEVTDIQAYVATNIGPQVDGDEDSIIVIAFRGTNSTSNLQTDLRSRQVPLLDQLAGIGAAPFCIYPDRVEVYDDDGWIWDGPEPSISERLQCVTSWTNPKPGCKPTHYARDEDPSALAAVSQGARKILQATPVARGSFPLVHEGFQDVYTQVRRKVLGILFPVLQRQLAKALEMGTQEEGREPFALPKIYTTGHSLGGAMAQLLALDLASNCEIVLPTAPHDSEISMNPEEQLFNLPSPSPYQTTKPPLVGKALRLQPPIGVYTFGQPRVGNKAFSRLYKQRAPHSFRVVNEGDAITTMPNFAFCGGIYKHAGLEVLLDEGMTGNILVGPTVVETVFRFHKVRTNMLAHTMARYRDCLECAFEEHELLEYYQGRNRVEKDSRGNQHMTNAEIPDWMTQVRAPLKKK